VARVTQRVDLNDPFPLLADVKNPCHTRYLLIHWFVPADIVQFEALTQFLYHSVHLTPKLVARAARVREHFHHLEIFDTEFPHCCVKWIRALQFGVEFQDLKAGFRFLA
jgi:hypothetical protein